MTAPIFQLRHPPRVAQAPDMPRTVRLTLPLENGQSFTFECSPPIADRFANDLLAASTDARVGLPSSLDPRLLPDQ